MSEFNWPPVASHQKTVTPRVQTARFGDGYEQRSSIGLNTMPEKWRLTFVGNVAETTPIQNFLKTRKGVQSFLWKTPEERTARFLCRSWEVAREKGALVTISCEFEEVFE